MKTREQLIEEIEYIPNLFFIQDGIVKFSLSEIIDLIIEACEEAVKVTKTPEFKQGYKKEDYLIKRSECQRILNNLKKLKSK